MTNQTSNQQKNIYLIPAAIVIAGLIIAGAVIYTKAPSSFLGLAGSDDTAQVAPKKDTEKQPNQVQKPTVNLTIDEEDHIRGNPEAPVTIVEFSDFQCPFCQRFHPTVKQALDDYPDKVRWVYKHFPLGFHEQAQPAAEASECVAEQKGNDGFWQFADGLFENQSRLGDDLYNELAQEIRINMSQFKECLSSGKYKDHVQADYQEGVEAGVRGTPGSFVNGKMVSGAIPYSTLKAAIEAALSETE